MIQKDAPLPKQIPEIFCESSTKRKARAGGRACVRHAGCHETDRHTATVHGHVVVRDSPTRGAWWAPGGSCHNTLLSAVTDKLL